MITRKTLNFLKDLKNNNNREWFTANKHRYEEAKAEFESFITLLIYKIQEFDKSIANVNPAKTIFRIYRDVRFSKDKSPYKENLGANIQAGGKQPAESVAGYYIHIEPGNCMIAGGAYMPPADVMNAIRREISRKGKDFHKIIDNKKFKSFFEIGGEKLQRPPKGFDPDDPEIEFLKYKSIYAFNKLTNNQILSPEILNHCVNAFKVLYPFGQFLAKAVENKDID